MNVSEHPDFCPEKPECFLWCLCDSLDVAIAAQPIVNAIFGAGENAYTEGLRQALRLMADITFYTPNKKVIPS